MIMRNWIFVFLLASASPVILRAQQPEATPAPAPATPTDPSADPAASDNSRLLGVLPNYMSTPAALPYEPISAKKKISLAAQESFDWPMYILNGGVTFLYLEQKKDPSYGRGLAGYGKEYAAVSGDQIISTMLDDGFFPALLREDPRYFRQATGSIPSRVKSSLLQTVVTRTDSGHRRFASAEWIGNAVAVAISSTYHHDKRTVSSESKQLVFQIGEDTATNVLEEFWPDLKRRFFHRHKAASS